jgi:DNA-binding transcriptional LysR family regulator
MHNGEAIQAPVNWRFFTNTNETAVRRRAVLSRAGIGMLPTCDVGDELRSCRLLPLLPDDYQPEELGIYAIYLSRQHQALALRLLVDFLAARFAGETAPWDLD